ncbi:MAG: LLM class flavin-dependent oxidoreductase, partial [Jatrophihabitans endophyticus]
DGAVPLFESARHGHAPEPGEVRELVGFIDRHRQDRESEPFDVVVGGTSDPATAADVLGPLREAGATWWDERLPQTTPDHHRAEPVLRRVEAGPPASG